MTIKEILDKICEVYQINYKAKEPCEKICGCEPSSNFDERSLYEKVQSIHLIQGIGGHNYIDMYDFLFNPKWKFAKTFFRENYRSHLQEMVLKEDLFDYLEDYYNDHWVKFMKKQKKLSKNKSRKNQKLKNGNKNKRS